MGNEVPLLLVDIDGVCAAFDPAFLHLLNGLTKQNKKFSQGEPIVWDWPIEELGFTAKQVDQAWEVIFKEGGYFWEYDVKPLPGAEEALGILSMLNQTGHAEVYFVTSRPGPRSQVRTANWLARWGYMGRPAVIVAREKGLVAQSLRAWARASYSIDDKSDNVHDFIRGGVTCSYLVDRRHNRDAHTWLGVKRVPTLKAALTAAGLVGYREEVTEVG